MGKWPVTQAAIYTQAEADLILKLPKQIDRDDWDNRATPSGRDDERRVNFSIAFVDPTKCPDTKITVTIKVKDSDSTMSLMLLAKIGKRPVQPLCRYEIQNNDHRNPDWYQPCVVESGEYHKHVYSVRAYEEFFGQWDKCADPLGKPKGVSSPASEFKALKAMFLEDLNIKIIDKNALSDLWSIGPNR